MGSLHIDFLIGIYYISQVFRGTALMRRFVTRAVNSRMIYYVRKFALCGVDLAGNGKLSVLRNSREESSVKVWRFRVRLISAQAMEICTGMWG